MTNKQKANSKFSALSCPIFLVSQLRIRSGVACESVSRLFQDLPTPSAPLRGLRIRTSRSRGALRPIVHNGLQFPAGCVPLQNQRVSKWQFSANRKGSAVREEES